MNNQDNHSPDWGTRDERRSGFFMGNLTREDMRQAMRARRSFMTYDKNAYLKVMADDTCWMGSILSGYDTLPLDIEAVDTDSGDGFASIDVYDSGMNVIATVDCLGETVCAGSFDLAVTEPTHFVVRADQVDGNWLVAAPIWVQP